METAARPSAIFFRPVVGTRPTAEISKFKRARAILLWKKSRIGHEKNIWHARNIGPSSDGMKLKTAARTIGEIRAGERYLEFSSKDAAMMERRRESTQPLMW
jgi:hypothetical protein